MNTITSGNQFMELSFLEKHILDTVEFYANHTKDEINGGYFNTYLNDGTVSDSEIRPLLGTARLIYIYSSAAILTRSDKYRDLAKRGITFLEEIHRDKEYGGYYWEVKGGKVEDNRKMAYGHAFALLAAASAYKADIAEAKPIIEHIYEILDQHFWREEDGLYVDEITADWSVTSPYRGQNANMHLCEAMMAAYEATGEGKYFERARQIAHSVMYKLLPQSGTELLWEHYDEHWKIDWDYEKGNTKNEFRPYGFVVGHSIEWSKLLQLLDRHQPEEWLFPRAEALFRHATDKGVDRKYGGIVFAISPDNKTVIDNDKVYWVQTEALGAAALFAARTDSEEYKEFYISLFDYCFTHFVDHQHGGWYQQLDRRNALFSTLKSPSPKADYHPVTNAMTAMLAFGGAAMKTKLKM